MIYRLISGLRPAVSAALGIRKHGGYASSGFSAATIDSRAQLCKTGCPDAPVSFLSAAQTRQRNTPGRLGISSPDRLGWRLRSPANRSRTVRPSTRTSCLPTRLCCVNVRAGPPGGRLCRRTIPITTRTMSSISMTMSTMTTKVQTRHASPTDMLQIQTCKARTARTTMIDRSDSFGKGTRQGFAEAARGTRSDRSWTGTIKRCWRR